MLSYVLTLLWIAGLPTFLLWAKWHLPVVPLLKPDRVAFLMSAVAFTIHVVRRPTAMRPPGRVERTLAVYLALIVASWCLTWHGKDLPMLKQDADFLLTCFLMPYAAFVIARNTEWSRERLTVCLWLLVAGVGTYLLFFGVLQYVVGWNALVPAALEAFQPDRAKGPFENAVPYGVVLAMLVPLTLGLYLRSRSIWQRVALVAIAVGLVQAIVASKTRAAWLAVPLSLLLPAFRVPRLRVVSALLTAFLAMQVLILPGIALGRHATQPSPAAPVAPATPPERGTQAAPSPVQVQPPEADFRGLQQRLVEPDPLYDRAAVLRIAVKMIADRPLFGFGFGDSTFQRYKTNYFAAIGSAAPFAEYPNNPHDDVLNVMVMMGAVGGICYLAVLWSLWTTLSASRRERGSDAGGELATCVQGVFLVVLLAGSFHSAMHMAYVQVLFYFLAGIVASAAPQRFSAPVAATA